MPFPFLSRRLPGKKTAASAARYLSDEAVAQYCDAHYGPDKLGIANFSKKIAQIGLNNMKAEQNGSALVLGCAVGRTAFELSTRFEQVTGVDFSSRFIEMAERLKKTGKLHYKLVDEGDILSEIDIRLADFGLDKTADRLNFCQGDAQDLDPALTGFDLVVAANLIDRIPDPGAFLSSIHERVAANGILLLATPNDWREKYTPKKNWLGGYFSRGHAVRSFEQIQKKLANHFALIGKPEDIQFALYKTTRTFSHGISQVTVWRKK